MFPSFRLKGRSETLHRYRSLCLFGSLAVVVYASIAWLSREFVYGQGHEQRPIGLFVGVFLAAWSIAMLAVRQVKQLPNWRLGGWMILTFAVLFRLALLWSQPIQEDDFYRYLWDGKVVARGLNPYRVTPLAVRNKNEGDAEVQRLARLVEDDEKLMLILSRVNHPEVPTIYPPLAEAVFGLTAGMAPDSLLALRVVLLGFDLAICGIVVSLLRRCGGDPLLVSVYAWSPLVIKETVNSAHYEVVPIFFLLLAFLFVLKDKIVLAYGSLALAILGKVFPVLVLPVFLWRTIKHQGRTQAFLGLGVVVVVVICGYAPFLDAGAKLWQGTLIFAGEWQINSLLFPLLGRLTGARWLTNAVVAVLLGGTVLALLGSYDVREDRQFLWVNFLSLGSLFLLSPVGNPWYFLWVMPLLCVFPLRSWLMLSGLLGLYYFWFFFVYRDAAETFQWVIWLEYVPFYGMLAWERYAAWQGIDESPAPTKPVFRASL